jgi:hypothetical protein
VHTRQFAEPATSSTGVTGGGLGAPDGRQVETSLRDHTKPAGVVLAVAPQLADCLVGAPG